MKPLLVALLLYALPLAAQEDETLFGSRSMDHGGFGAVVAKGTRVNGKFGMLLGARGGWIVDHSFSVGAGVYGLVNNVRARTEGPRGEPYLNMFYGGLDLEYVYSPRSLVHFSLHSLIGAGAVGFRRGLFAGDGYPHAHMAAYVDPYGRSGFPGAGWWDASSRYFEDPWYGGRTGRLDPFFVFEPGANVDLNVTTWLRTSLGGSYRFVSGLRSAAAASRDLSGPSAMLTFRFGSF